MGHYSKVEVYKTVELEVEVTLSTGSTNDPNAPQDTHTLVLLKAGVFDISQAGVLSEDLLAVTAKLFDFGRLQIDGVENSNDPTLARFLIDNGFEYSNTDGTLPPTEGDFNPNSLEGFIGDWNRNSNTDTDVNGNVETWEESNGNGLNFYLSTPTGPAYNPVRGDLEFTGAQGLELDNPLIGTTRQYVTVFMALTSSAFDEETALEYTTNGLTNNGFGVSLYGQSGSTSLSPTATAYSGGNVGNSSNKKEIVLNTVTIIRAQFYRNTPSPQTTIFVDGEGSTDYPLGNSVNTNMIEANATLFLGSRAGTSLFANMNLKQLVIIANQLTEQEALDTDNYIKELNGTS